MIYRMGAALLSLVGVFVSAYLYLYKIGRIGTLACGTGGCETVQTSVVEPVPGRRRRADRPRRVRPAVLRRPDGAATRAGRGAVAGRAARRTRRRGRAVHGLPHLPRAVRYPRHLPLVRWLGFHHPVDSSWPSSRYGGRRSRRPAEVSDPAKAPPVGRALATLSLGALGVVYGDIGTSPLYALKECFMGSPRLSGRRAQRAGHPLAHLLVAQLRRHLQVPHDGHARRQPGRGRHSRAARAGAAQGRRRAASDGCWWPRGLFGSALLYGDGIITPAISVLGAVEGLSIATPALEHLRRSDRVRHHPRLVRLAAARDGRRGRGVRPGHPDLVHLPSRRSASRASPTSRRCCGRSTRGTRSTSSSGEGLAPDLMVLAAIILVVTGGEALYADMGHFGRRPIRLAWFVVVLPALVLNYFGQGALLLARSFRGPQPVLLAGAGVGALSDGGAGDRGRGRRVPGAHLRRLLADPPGGAARLLSPGQHRAHLEDRDRPDLHPRREQPADGGVPRPGRHVRLGGPPGRAPMVWPCRAP